MGSRREAIEALASAGVSLSPVTVASSGRGASSIEHAHVVLGAVVFMEVTLKQRH
jgi:hypothetical protein